MRMNPSAMGIRVFVYGTLKQGRSNHRVLQSADLLGRVKLSGKWKMLNLKHYPGLIYDGSANGERQVLGEVYRVTKEQLDVLDMIEGHPDYYQRSKIQTPWKSAWCYFLPMDYDGRFEPVEPVENVQVWMPSDAEREYLTMAANGI